MFQLFNVRILLFVFFYRDAFSLDQIIQYYSKNELYKFFFSGMCEVGKLTSPPSISSVQAL
ncbi:hypothetical protein PECL_1651 [Pediococcus claussenii ATCC BAA-344]|uniref:Uncharacterized protein n=1 Tax=Pediococcus claussenii (strain ATCC BAA-344 / DSM 14800 / JCM 18046 / KCTC 3811 / LMG 21948 / P06) TaxID=701521 RepID=G8PB00_PEDCP|nr:hypothetical protein PECL_1651 [Pediococcus claussenii ATCC BAA-344]KRN20475.1 hypothetical protein IV79_GL000530 [Pediococcus claussenii]